MSQFISSALKPAATPTRNEPCSSWNVRSVTFGIASASLSRPHAVPQVAYPSMIPNEVSG